MMSSGMHVALIFFHVYHTILAFTGCILNSLLIYVAIFHSPKAIRSYATLIVNFAVTDFLECALDYFLQPRLIPAPWDITLTFILNEPCASIGPTTCYVALSFFLHCIPHAVWSLLLSFAYRYYILHHPVVCRKKLLIVLFLVYLPSLLQGLTYWTNFVERDDIVPIVQKSFPTYDFAHEKGVITGVTNIFTISATYAISHMAFPITPVYIAIFILRRKIIGHLTSRASSMTNETRAVHSQLLKVLTIQSLIPVFVWMGVTAYFLGQLGIFNHPLMEYMMFGSCLILPTISPLTYLVYVRPYRHYCIRIWMRLTCNKSETYAISSAIEGIKFNSKNSTTGGGGGGKVAPFSITMNSPGFHNENE